MRCPSSRRAHRASANVQFASPPPPAGDDLASIIATMSEHWVDEFSAATLDNASWRILGETAGSTAVGAVIAWSDHWGPYLHDPNLVTISGGALRLGWAKVGSQWYAGAVTTAAAYGYSASNPAPLRVTPIDSVIVARIKLPATGGNFFAAFWALGRNNQAGAWPTWGEIDYAEVTYPIPPNGDKDLYYSNLHWPDEDNSAVRSSAGTGVSPFDEQYHEIACHRRWVNGQVKIDMFVDGTRYGTITAPRADIFSGDFLTILSAQAGHWGNGAPDANTSGRYMEVAWVKEYRIATPPPPSGDKPDILYGAADQGMPLIFQDTLHLGDPPNLAGSLWGQWPGWRNNAIAAPSTNVANTVAIQTQTLGGKPARRVFAWLRPKDTWFGWEHTLMPPSAAYQRAAVAWDIFIPSDYSFLSDNGKTDGKTCIGLITAPAGTPTYIVAEGGNTWPWQQIWNGGATAHHGLNFGGTGGVYRLKLYSHVLRIGGAACQRKGDGSGGLIGTSFVVPYGRWVTIEMMIRMDTNGLNGVLSVWMTDLGVTTRVIHYSNLDFGGAIGSRNYVSGPRENNFAWGTTPQNLVLTSPAFVRGAVSREMPGGWAGTDTAASRADYWNNSTKGANYSYNFRLYGS